VIFGNGARIAVVFAGTENESCLLEGFTLTRGSLIGSDRLGAGISGGTIDKRTRATIRLNRIVNNQESGIACCNGLIQDNLIGSNTSWKGAGGLAYCDGVIRGNQIIANKTFKEHAAGGLAYCNGVIENNLIAGNAANSMASSSGGLAWCAGTIRSNIIGGNSGCGDAGGGLDHCTGTIHGNVITNNLTDGGGALGGLTYCQGTIQANTISGNHQGGLSRCTAAILNNLIIGNKGHGAVECNGPIQNNTICHNTGIGLYECHGPILNCILWNNSDDRPDQLRNSSVPAYSCIQHWGGGGVGNLASAPHFVNAQAGDFHLQTWSPCIDAGDPASDSSNEPLPGARRIDLGAFGNTAEAAAKSPDADADDLPDDWERHWFGGVETGSTDDPDGDGIINLAEYAYGWNPQAPAATRVHNRTQARWYQTIQAALANAVKDDELVVEPGLYRENIHFQGKDVHVRSTDPLNLEVAARTIIDGFASGPTVTFAGTEDEEYCVLEGFTIRHGDANCSQVAGGICGGTEDRHTKAQIHNNIITGNKAERGGALIYCDGFIHGNIITNNQAWAGAGLAFCNGVIEANTISQNSATLGGGLLNCDGTIDRNVIAENLGHGGGGGLLNCHGLVQRNLIRGNWTEQDESAGGGLKGCDALIRNNVIANNRTRCDGGGGLANCSGTIENNLITGNTSDGGGGGLYGCNGLIQNNTIAQNRGYGGGGLSYCTGGIRNCIIWGNTPRNGPQLADCSVPTYSCIEHWPEAGLMGNIAADPHFVEPGAGNFHLRTWSPCIDAGDPASDCSFEPSPSGGRIDLGAYGNTPETVSRSLDSDNDRLPDDWERHWFGGLAENGDSDPDQDGIVNLTEYRYAWDPRARAETRVQNLTQGRWYQTIQVALVESANGDEILVHPAVYRENVLFSGRNITLRSTDPTRSAVVAATVIDGQQTGPVVTFSGTENETCVLAGLTLRHGTTDISGCGTKATIIQNRVTANADSGMAGCQGRIRNNTIWANSAGYGGGLYGCHGLIENCTIYGNSASWGGGLHECNGVILNCIVWGNCATRDAQIYHSSQPAYSCIQDWSGGGEGNLALDPQFIAPDQGDFHLVSWSPCIDAGNPTSDFSQEPVPNGGRVDLGAYGNTPEATSGSADSDADALPDDWERHWFGDLRYDAAADPDSDNIPNAREYRYGWSPVVASPTRVQNTTQGAHFATIQAALSEAAAGDVLMVQPGTYRENIHFPGANVVLTSTYAQHPEAVVATILDGGGRGPVMTFTGNEDASCVLSGFTIQNGNANEAGGIFGEGTHATIRNNVVRNNTAAMWGGGLYYCHGLIQNCVITHNSADSGGGLSHCDGVVQNCTIVGNSAGWHAAVDQCHATFRNCILWDNASTEGGSGTSFWPGAAVYSCIEGWTGGGDGNTARNPQFISAPNNDYRLSATSPCIDAGDNNAPNLSETDLAGNRRVLFGGKSHTVDMGACEFNLAVSTGPGSIDLTFPTHLTWAGRDLDAGPRVHDMVKQPDGKVVIVGFFDHVNGVARPHIARLLPNGELDLTFNPVDLRPVEDTQAIQSVALQPDGKLVITGTIETVPWGRRGMARLNPDGTLDRTFSPAMEQSPMDVAIQPDGRILLAGWYVAEDSIENRHIARLNADGSLDSSFNATAVTNGVVNRILIQPDGRIVIGGYTADPSSTYRAYLARLNPDGALDRSFDTMLQGPFVYAMTLQPDGKLLVGGSFTNVWHLGDSAARTNFVRLNTDGSVDISFRSTRACHLFGAITVAPDGRLLVAAEDLSAEPGQRYGVSRLQADGTIDSTFAYATLADDFGGGCWAGNVLLQPDATIWIGGIFSACNGVPSDGLIRLNGDAPRAAPFVERQIGAQWSVSLVVQPPPGTKVYSVEDQPSWGPVANISHGGRYDTQTGKVTFGPFADAQPRTLSYSIVIPPGAAGWLVFKGTATADGVATPIVGDDSLRLWEFPPPLWLQMRWRPLSQKTVVQVWGERSAAYEIAATTNLQDWRVIGSLTNSLGVGEFVDPDAGANPHRFYRAKQIP